MSVSDFGNVQNIVKLRMELQTFDPGIFMVTTLAVYPGCLARTGATCPGDEARRPTCNRLGNYYP